VAILKMVTARKFSISGHHYLPTYQILMISDNVEFLRLCGGHFENGDRRNFSMSGINSGHHYLPIYRILTMLNFYRPFFMPCFGSHFENGRHFENFENTELLL
jgi:hypothetical protein